MKEWIMMILFLSEPVLIAGCLCYLSYRKLRNDNKKFTFTMIDLVGLVVLMGVLLWISVSGFRRNQRIDDPELNLYQDSEAIFFLALMWAGALSGVFIWHCYALQNNKITDATTILFPIAYFLAAMAGVICIYIVLMPWALFWAWIASG
jgi:hypothetical protein